MHSKVALTILVLGLTTALPHAGADETCATGAEGALAWDACASEEGARATAVVRGGGAVSAGAWHSALDAGFAGPAVGAGGSMDGPWVVLVHAQAPGVEEPGRVMVCVIAPDVTIDCWSEQVAYPGHSLLA